MNNYFFEQKYAALTLATKIFKNQEYQLFLPKGIQHTALVGKTIWLEAGRLQRSLENALKALQFRGEGSRMVFGITNKEKEQTIRDNGQRKKQAQVVDCACGRLLILISKD